MNNQYCSKCGGDIPKKETFCTKCGSDIQIIKSKKIVFSKKKGLILLAGMIVCGLILLAIFLIQTIFPKEPLTGTWRSDKNTYSFENGSVLITDEKEILKIYGTYKLYSGQDAIDFFENNSSDDSVLDELKVNKKDLHFYDITVNSVRYNGEDNTDKYLSYLKQNDSVTQIIAVKISSSEVNLYDLVSGKIGTISKVDN